MILIMEQANLGWVQGGWAGCWRVGRNTHKYRSQPFASPHVLVANASVRKEEADITFQWEELQGSVEQDKGTGRVEDCRCFPNGNGGEITLIDSGFL